MRNYIEEIREIGERLSIPNLLVDTNDNKVTVSYIEGRNDSRFKREVRELEVKYGLPVVFCPIKDWKKY